jgi:hypothetical protein
VKNGVVEHAEMTQFNLEFDKCEQHKKKEVFHSLLVKEHVQSGLNFHGYVHNAPNYSPFLFPNPVDRDQHDSGCTFEKSSH